MLKNFFLLFLLLLIITAIAFLFSGRLSFFLAHKILDGQYGWSLTAQKGHLDLIEGSLEMNRVWLRSPQGKSPEIVIMADHIAVSIDHSEVLHGQRIIQKLVLDGMRLKHISSGLPDAQTKKNIGEVQDKALRQDANQFLIRQLVVKNGFIEFIHQKNSLRKTNITLDNVNITANDVHIGKGLDAFLKSMVIDQKF